MAPVTWSDGVGRASEEATALPIHVPAMSDLYHDQHPGIIIVNAIDDPTIARSDADCSRPESFSQPCGRGSEASPSMRGTILRRSLTGSASSSLTAGGYYPQFEGSWRTITGPGRLKDAMSHLSMDPDGYLERIGYTGPGEPTPELIRRLHRAHMQAVPFESVSG
jgi:hypothetical protein